MAFSSIYLQDLDLNNCRASAVMRLPIRPVLRWSIPAILLAALTNGLYNALPAEPRWVVRQPGEILAVRPEGILLGQRNGPSIRAPARLLDPQTGQVRHKFKAKIAGL